MTGVDMLGIHVLPGSPPHHMRDAFATLMVGEMGEILAHPAIHPAGADDTMRSPEFGEQIAPTAMQGVMVRRFEQHGKP